MAFFKFYYSLNKIKYKISKDTMQNAITGH